MLKTSTTLKTYIFINSYLIYGKLLLMTFLTIFFNSICTRGNAMQHDSLNG